MAIDLVQEEKEVEVSGFLDVLKQRVNDDFTAAFEFMKPYHAKCKVWHNFYHASEQYTDLRKKNKMPVTWVQEDVDTFKADARDKLFHTGRPCRIVGREEEDKSDAEAKQEFQDYQDEEDDMFGKCGLFLRDCALYLACAAQVSYEERTRREWILKPIPVPAVDDFGQPVLNEAGEFVPAIDPQNPGQVLESGEEEWVLEEITYFRGASVKRIDMQNVFFTIDKGSMSDQEPVMVRQFVDREFYNSQPYFINKEVLDQRTAATGNQDTAKEKKANPQESNKPFEYLEWQGYVDKQSLYEYQKENSDLKIVTGSNEPDFDIDREMGKLRDNERTLVVLGMTDGEVVSRLQEDPLRWGKPNIIIGVIDEEEDSPTGRGIAQMIECYQRAGEHLHDILFENFKQSVNAMWYINSSVMSGRKQITNKAGAIIEGTVDADKAIKRIEQPRVAADIYGNIDRFRDAARRADGVNVILTGQADPNAETLGETQIALAQSNLRMRDYIRAHEKSFIVPMYALRNHINATWIDKDYAFKIIGKKADNWRVITAVQMRASVDFICESSARETNRAVKTQQIIAFIKIAPFAAAAGQPVRFDKMMADLGETGFGMSRDTIESYFPLLKKERENPDDNIIDDMLIQNALTAMFMGAGAGAAQTNGNGTGGKDPQPLTEGQAVQGANAQNQPNPGRFNR